MPSTGRLSLQTVAVVNPGDSPGYASWVNAANALSANADVAVTTLYDTDISQRLNLTNAAAVAAAIPVGATITGFAAYVRARQVDVYGATSVQQLQSRLIREGVVAGTLFAAVMLPSTVTELTLGGDGQLNGSGWTRDQAIAATSGLSLRTYRNVGDELSDKYSEIQFVQIEWFFTGGAVSRSPRLPHLFPAMRMGF